MPSNDLEIQTLELGKAIFKDAAASSPSIFSTEFYTGKLIEWGMGNEDFRIALFRFVDVLPALGSDAEVIEHVNAYFKPVAKHIPWLVRWGVDMSPSSPLAGITAGIVRKQVRSMATRFILGESTRGSLKKIRGIRRRGMAFSIDLLGEAALSERESLDYKNRYIELIQTLHSEMQTWKESAPIIEGHPCERSPINISVKLTALYSQAKGIAAERSVKVLTDRLTEIIEVAKACDCYVNVDMEDTDSKDYILETVKNVYTSDAFKDYDKLGFVFQAYLRDTEQDLKNALKWMETRGAKTIIRLVKGAYWDTETIMSKLSSWPIPVWQEKSDSDIEYEKLSRLLLDHSASVIPAFGSHNIRSLCHAIAYAEHIGLDKTAYELQALFGMADPIKEAFISRGYLVREYAPIGELIPGMGYLVRRLLENTSNKGFIRQGFHDNEDPETLLQKPQSTHQDTGKEHLNMDIRKTFFSWPLVDFAIETHRECLQRDIDTVLSKIKKEPSTVLPIISGEAITSKDVLVDHSPHDTQTPLSRVHMASVEMAEKAVVGLRSYFPIWRDTPTEERTEILFKTAEILEAKRSMLTAIIILESGKPWAEADADIAEAIDFLHYYALHAEKLFDVQSLCDLDGEEDFLFYEPRGICLTIGPWNFPCAIPCGMFAAAIVTGNCAIMKPAEQSSWIASEVFKAFLEAGLPPQACAFLPGRGEVIGPVLVDHPDISTIVFTGSKAVGLEIIEKASRVNQGQEHVKRVIAEMGGKNAIIIDGDADLDQAVKGVIQGAFAFSGQKCSACSRVIVLESIYERFIERLKDSVTSLVIGPATDPATTVCPLIDEEAAKRLHDAIALAKKDATLLTEGMLTDAHKDGHYVAPTVFKNIKTDHMLAQQEFFGPLLAVIQAPDFETAIEMAMDTQYALTGGVYSRNPKNLKRAVQAFRVGNLYLNRPCTGAMVGRQPFGGFKMSGVGSKAGGPDYLQQFVIPRAISENTMRQGFAPMKA